MVEVAGVVLRRSRLPDTRDEARSAGTRLKSRSRGHKKPANAFGVRGLPVVQNGGGGGS